MVGATPEAKLKAMANKFSMAEITLVAFNNQNIAGSMNCSTAFSSTSEFRCYRNNTGSTEWGLYLKNTYYCGQGTFDISASRNNNTTQTYL